jgi:uncharacterized protein (DUF362 family)
MLRLALIFLLPFSAHAIPDLVGVRNGSSVQMFEAGIKEYGGLGHFVKKGSTVLVKPNMGFNKSPSEGATSNPDLVGIIVKHALKAGAKTVWVMDHSTENEAAVFETTGIKKAAEANGAVMLTAEDKGDYRKKIIKKGKALKDVLVHKAYLDADVVINVPVLKNHGGATMTASIKNLMGVVWDRRYWHGNDLHQCIADFPLVKKPTLNVLDAYNVMIRYGPRGSSPSDLVLKKMMVISTDMVLADVAAAKILGMDPNKIPYLKMAQEHGIGSMDMKKANIKRVAVGKK